MGRFFSFFAKAIIDDWQLKVMSFVIAVALFFMVRSDKDAEGVIYINVDYINKPANHMILNDLNYNVRIVVNGPWALIKKINKTTYTKRLTVDLARVGGDRYELDTTMFDLPKNIKVSSISPQYLPVKMEPILKRIIPMNLKVSTDRFFHVSEVKITPNKFKISGPKSAVVSIVDIPLPPLHVKTEGVTEKEIPLPELGPNITIEPNLTKVQVKIFVDRAVSSRKFSGISVNIEGSQSENQELQITPSVVDIYVEGDKKTLYSLPPSRLRPIVYLNRLPGDELIWLNVSVKGLPNSFSYRVQPARVQVSTKKTPVTPGKPDAIRKKAPVLPKAGGQK